MSTTALTAPVDQMMQAMLKDMVSIPFVPPFTPFFFITLLPSLSPHLGVWWMHDCASSWALLCKSMHMWRSEVKVWCFFLYHSPLYFLRQGLLLNPELTVLVMMPSHEPLGSPYLPYPSPSTGITDMSFSSHLLHECCRAHLRSPCFAHFTLSAISTVSLPVPSTEASLTLNQTNYFGSVKMFVI